ncbi:M16 family metallopeptidase [Limoniibacter endophyticus]|uniref:Peptidase M16 n=1 Tax=Limoniibacter endophyticus TaxID=1565040 RepID=A0A8J3DG22_9HYPH|nr:pitrilysin family protein [Limoniibacter endophyticus]GHC67880.1 peptidase M16 [Limoniibacter endophyticus]
MLVPVPTTISHAQETPQPQITQSQPGAERTEVETFTLENGLTIVVLPDKRIPFVTHMLWYKVGSADEPKGKSGIAHFFEHLMFKGTTNHKAGEFSQTVSAAGGSENAFTSTDYTAYYQIVPPQHLKTMMEFEADRMRNLVLSDEVVDTERSVILEERRMRVDNNPSAVLGEEVSATLFQNHPYRIPIIGWMQEIEQLNREDAIAFYNRYYEPNNATLVVAGDVDPQEVLKLAEETYGKIAKGPEIGPRLRPSEPQQDTRRTVTMRDDRITTPSFSTSWIVPAALKAENGEAEALDLLAEILGGGTLSRLQKKLVVEDQTASSAGASYDGLNLDYGTFSVNATPRGEESVEAMEKQVQAEVERIIESGPTQEELEAAKTRFTRGMVFARDSQIGMANTMGLIYSIGGNADDFFGWTDRVKKITAAQVQAVARKYLDYDRSVTAYLLPKPAEEKAQN